MGSFPSKRAVALPDRAAVLKTELYHLREFPEALEAYQLSGTEEAWLRVVLGLIKKCVYYRDENTRLLLEIDHMRHAARPQ